jgi:CDP-paratose 2-epimerase
LKWFITGGAGFIGCNCARRLIEEGQSLIILDNLSRKGAELNLEWLKRYGRFEFVKGDVREPKIIEETVRRIKPDVVLHLAAQVAVTTSVTDPRTDFEINALGTFNVCEAVRRWVPEAILLNASTNKVYGAMEGVRVVECKGRYAYADLPNGVSETQPLDFHSPYGCSKGGADQYVHDYHRIYGLRTVNFRQSCIYGYRQFGIEDQGWVAWFTIAAVLGKPITIYGDGKQVRDILFIEDLVDCYITAVERIDHVMGDTLNIGGGMSNTLSLLELVTFLEEQLGHSVTANFGPWRPGDQKVFVCDIRKADEKLGWSPRIRPAKGVGQLITWVKKEKTLLSGVFC